MASENKSKVSILTNGIIKENPVLRLVLGTCSCLAVTTAVSSALGMGAAFTFVLVCSNILISLLRNVIPAKVHLPCYIVIIAGFVTIVQMVMHAYMDSLYTALGVFLPLIVVNCIILGRAESYASKNPVMASTFDGIGMGLGFTVALTCIGLVREILGAGAFFGHVIIPEDFHISIFILAPGAFFVLAVLTALQNKFKAPSATNGSVPQSRLACGGDCMNCSGSSCMSNHEILETRKRQAEEDALASKKADLAKKEVELKAATSKKEE